MEKVRKLEHGNFRWVFKLKIYLIGLVGLNPVFAQLGMSRDHSLECSNIVFKQVTQTDLLSMIGVFFMSIFTAIFLCTQSNSIKKPNNIR